METDLRLQGCLYGGREGTKECCDKAFKMERPRPEKNRNPVLVGRREEGPTPPDEHVTKTVHVTLNGGEKRKRYSLIMHRMATNENTLHRGFPVVTQLSTSSALNLLAFGKTGVTVGSRAPCSGPNPLAFQKRTPLMLLAPSPTVRRPRW